MPIPVGTIIIGVLEALKVWGQIMAMGTQQAGISAEDAKAAFLEGFDGRIAELRKPIDEVRE